MVSIDADLRDLYEITRRLMVLDGFPTAIFAINDHMAIGAYYAIQDKGMTVGKDISVAGFDNIPVSRIVNPALSTNDPFPHNAGFARLYARGKSKIYKLI